jgi:hypothetical protein
MWFKHLIIGYWILSVLCLTSVKSQSIYSRLSREVDLVFNKKSLVDHVEIESILYGLSGNNETRKEVHYFNAQQRAINGQSYFLERGYRGSYQNEFRDDTLLVKRNVFSSGPYNQNDNSVITYHYDQNNFLIKQIKIEGATDIYEEMEYLNDEQGNPIKLIIDGGKYGYEAASYDYPNNIVYTSIVNTQNVIISNSKALIDYTVKNPKYKYNEYGDVVDEDTYKFSYKYDDKANWIKRTRKNKKLNKTDQVVTRKITYR